MKNEETILTKDNGSIQWKVRIANIVWQESQTKFSDLIGQRAKKETAYKKVNQNKLEEKLAQHDGRFSFVDSRTVFCNSCQSYIRLSSKFQYQNVREHAITPKHTNAVDAAQEEM